MIDKPTGDWRNVRQWMPPAKSRLDDTTKFGVDAMCRIHCSTVWKNMYLGFKILEAPNSDLSKVISTTAGALFSTKFV